MLTNLWIDSRKHNWNRLEALTARVETDGVKSLGPDDLRDFGLLYRQSAADLSAARADGAARTLEQYLNRLVGRAHNFVYSGRKLGFRSLWDFFAHGYPRLLRRLSGYVVLSTSIFVLGAVLGTLVSVTRPDFQHAFMSRQMLDDLDHHKMWTERILSEKPQESSAIMTNNITVCFISFAGGISAGLLTLWSLFFNGLMLGVIAVACAQHHMALSLWSFVAAHGALELPAIFLAGAAGLRIASGILFPGMLRRRDSIALAGSEAVQLVAGIIPMLIVAGTLEAFLSPTHAPIALKFAVGALLFTALCFWLGEGGRKTVNSE
ncbi:MAG: stage II sporulation protein M [Acidobacteriota bacterium]|nr:stage II sporulation protein M [Acidobacteriota bacterium]